MTPEQFQKLNENIVSTIRMTVNGKIDGLRSELQAYITDDTAWKAVDGAWKTDAQPAIDLGTSVRGFGMVMAYLLGTLTAIGTLVGIVYGFCKK